MARATLPATIDLAMLVYFTYGVTSNDPNMVMLCPGNVQTNWYVPAAGATKLTDALSPAANKGALATTFASFGSTQLLSWPATKPAVDT